MSAVKVLGSSEPVVTTERKETSDREASFVEVEGPYSEIKLDDPKKYCPSGFTVESSNIQNTGNGMGKMSIKCVKYETGFSFGAERTTFRIDMKEVCYDLKEHPSFSASSKDIILKWLATPENKRKKDGSYAYVDDKNKQVTISDANALKFCNAYMNGITTFNRYYPVIEKISIWKNPPGMSRNERSFTGGSPDFSSGIGRYNNPPLTLSGYPSTNWFKSKDSWMQNADTTWTRTEEWTYTPDSSSGEHAWIYNALT